MNRLALLSCLLLLFFGKTHAQQTPQLSKFAKISVLTCGPGDELYSSFGHSAVRVKDESQGIDGMVVVIYNVG